MTAATEIRQRSFSRVNSKLVTPVRQNTVNKAQSVPMRQYEIAALRKDGTVFVGQERAPATPLFESAFSAFARGTLIETPNGNVAVEDLAPGDMINTVGGSAQKLVWIGASSFVPADAGRPTPLTRIMADSFGQSRPSMFLTAGPAARILHSTPAMRAEANGKAFLTRVSEFIDGVNVIEVSPPTTVRLYHICLERHSIIRAGGIEMETYHPMNSGFRKTAPSYQKKFLSMFPQIDNIRDFGELIHPRAPEIQNNRTV